MPRIRRLAAALAVGLLIVPAVAAADDQSTYDTWHAAHPRFVKLRKDFERAKRHWEDSGWRDPDPAYRAARKTESLATKITNRLKADTTSTSTGARALAQALRG